MRKLIDFYNKYDIICFIVNIISGLHIYKYFKV